MAERRRDRRRSARVGRGARRARAGRLGARDRRWLESPAEPLETARRVQGAEKPATGDRQRSRPAAWPRCRARSTKRDERPTISAGLVGRVDRCRSRGRRCRDGRRAPIRTELARPASPATDRGRRPDASRAEGDRGGRPGAGREPCGGVEAATPPSPIGRCGRSVLARVRGASEPGRRTSPARTAEQPRHRIADPCRRRRTRRASSRRPRLALNRPGPRSRRARSTAPWRRVPGRRGCLAASGLGRELSLQLRALQPRPGAIRRAARRPVSGREQRPRAPTSRKRPTADQPPNASSERLRDPAPDRADGRRRRPRARRYGPAIALEVPDRELPFVAMATATRAVIEVCVRRRTPRTCSRAPTAIREGRLPARPRRPDRCARRRRCSRPTRPTSRPAARRASTRR